EATGSPISPQPAPNKGFPKFFGVLSRWAQRVLHCPPMPVGEFLNLSSQRRGPVPSVKSRPLRWPWSYPICPYHPYTNAPISTRTQALDAHDFLCPYQSCLMFSHFSCSGSVSAGL